MTKSVTNPNLKQFLETQSGKPVLYDFKKNHGTYFLIVKTGRHTKEFRYKTNKDLFRDLAIAGRFLRAEQVTLGKTGIAFNSREGKDVRASFEPVSERDFLAMYVDGLKIDPASWDRFGDRNYRTGSKSQAFNLRWIKKGAAKLDQAAIEVKGIVPGFENADESDIISQMVDLITEYPTGLSEYFFDSVHKGEHQYYSRFEYPGDQSNSDIDDELFKADMRKRFRKPVKRETTKRIYTPELAIIRRFYAMHGNKVTTKQLHDLYTDCFNILPELTSHVQLIKIIHAKIGVVIYKLDGKSITEIQKLEITGPLLKKLQNAVGKPVVKSVTLGHVEEEFDQSLAGVFDEYTPSEIKDLGIVEHNPLGKSKNKSPYEVVNDKLVELLKAGDLPWINQRNHSAIQGQDGTFKNYITKRAYSGVNVWILATEVDSHHSNFFLTKNQIKSKGGTLRKEAKPFLIFFRKKLKITNEVPVTESNPTGTVEKDIYMLRQYLVYNLADTNIEIKDSDIPKVKTEQQVIESCEEIYPNMPKKPVLRFGGKEAFYMPSKDFVQMPTKEHFTTLQGYYRTLFHELVHSTGHESRLKRKFGSKLWGDERQYSIEELIAEIGSSYICAHTGIFFANKEKHASYLNHYLKALHGSKLEQYKADLVLKAQEDKTFLLHAIGKAQQAANFILSKQLKKQRSQKKAPKQSLSGNDPIIEAIKEVWPKASIIELPGRNAKIADASGTVTSGNFTPINRVKSEGTHTLPGEIGKLVPDLGNESCSITIKGDQGAGKSQLAWMFADAYADMGKRVAFVCPEMSAGSPVISGLRDRFVKPDNQKRILFSDKKWTVEQLEEMGRNGEFDVLIVDSFTGLDGYKQAQFKELADAIPNIPIVGLLQSTTSGDMRGGNRPEYDAYVNIEVVKVDDSFVNNYAVCTKNRFGATGDRFNISKRKVIKQSLSGVTPKKAIKKKGVK